MSKKVTDSQEQRRIEDAERASSQSAQLAAASMELLGCRTAADVYEVIDSFIGALCPGSGIVSNEVTPDRRFFITRSVSGADASLLEKAAGLVGFEIVGKRWVIHPGFLDQLLTGRLDLISGGFAELAAQDLPQQLSAALSRLFGIHDLYTIGISDRTAILGNIVILTRSARVDMPVPIIEAFARHCFSALANIARETDLAQQAEHDKLMLESMVEGLALHEIILDGDGKPCDYRFLDVNPAFESMTGLMAEDLIGHTVLEVLPGTEPSWIERYGAVALTGVPAKFEDYSGALGRYFEVSAYSPQPGQFATLVSDVTDRKHAEFLVRTSEQRYRAVSETVPTFVYSCVREPGGEFRIDWIAGAVEMVTGYAPEEVLAHECWRFMVLPEDFDLFDAEVLGIAPGETGVAELRIVGPDGTVRWVRSTARVTDMEGRPGSHQLIGGCEDITVHKVADEALRQSRDMIINLTDLVPGVVYQYRLYEDGHSTFPFSSRGMIDIYEYAPEDLWEDAGPVFGRLHPEDYDRVAADIAESARTLGHFHCEFRVNLPRQGLRWRLSDAVPQRLEDGSTLWHGIISDITERKHAEAERELNALRVEVLLKLNQMSDASLHEITDFTLEEAVELTQSEIGYLAFLNEDETVLTMHSWSKSAMAECAIEDKPLIYPVATTGLWGESVRQRRPVITNDYAAPDPLKKGYPEGHVALRRHMAVPIFEGSRIVAVAGVGNKATEYAHADARQLTLLVEGMWRLLERKRATEELLVQKERIDRTLTSVIDIASDIVEVRDPYTAGHQRRVAELAVSIAKDLGMADSDINNVRVASLMHDIGKVVVPAEILGKPGTISPMERELLKAHAEAGHRIIATAHMDEPIAELVYQHHERIDGSGYPRGLDAGHMLDGAKVIAVADVVEAMSSHRPYRPALGLEAALAEIESGAGRCYDAEAARACIALFREGRFEFS